MFLNFLLAGVFRTSASGNCKRQYANQVDQISFLSNFPLHLLDLIDEKHVFLIRASKYTTVQTLFRFGYLRCQVKDRR